jgi:hypothetical protein
MKLIEAMKRVKQNKEKVVDLQKKVADHCANLAHETPLYGTETPAKVREWLQACTDLSQENVRLLLAIQRTNLATAVTVLLDGKSISKCIAAWVWRRREYAAMDLATWGKLTDRGLKEGLANTSTGQPFELKLVRHYDPVQRDTQVSMYKSEPHEIDAALEIINAVTDLLEG